jgi:hypothetical protein
MRVINRFNATGLYDLTKVAKISGANIEVKEIIGESHETGRVNSRR